MPPTGPPAKPAPRKAKAPSHKKSPRTEPKKAGRPLRIDEVIAHRQDGTPVSIGEQVISAVEAGNYVETAAASAGISKTTLYDWMRTGARLTAEHEQGRRSRFSADERRLMEFSNAVGRAIANSEARDVAVLARLAAGGLPVVVETIRVRAGDGEGDASEEVLERTTRTTHTLPEASVLEWRLERRFRERWGRSVEVTGPGGGALAIDVSTSAREALEKDLDRIHDRLGRAGGPPPVPLPPQEPAAGSTPAD